jgi:squalene-hopene/tetraprenyl-beta-curcumene cyclase
LENFIVEDEATLRLQPAVSPVWDTAWAIIALRESGLPADHSALKKAAHWLLDQEIRSTGDWQVKNPNTEPGGWAFEFENQMYPDLDDSAVVSRALRRVQLSDEMEETKAQAIGRAHRWIMDMQSKDGGWAAFDRDNNKMILAQVPYVDFMSPLDPTCPDVTAHVVELLGELETQQTCLQRALDYLTRTQESDGAWYGRWGVNYLYGTSLVLTGLISAGVSPEKTFIQRAVDWLVGCQNSDGGWGETCRSYAEPDKRGRGLSTASQTAWALTGLMAAGGVSSQAVREGIQYLVRTQSVDGTWREEDYSGTGFPRLFYLRYEYYSLYFPLIALARYKDNMKSISNSRVR